MGCTKTHSSRRRLATDGINGIWNDYSISGMEKQERDLSSRFVYASA
jgi:hypothetical protein